MNRAVIWQSTMGAALQYDDGPVLIANCDSCIEQIVAFGAHDSTREELDSRIVAEGWVFRGGSAWLCSRCGDGKRILDLPLRIRAISVLTMPN